jgi:DNA-binding PadR family transcriptional regulator
MMWWLIGLSATALLVLVLWDLFLTRWSSAASVVMGALQSQPDEPMSARELREQVRWSGGWGRMSAPVFYQMMSGLERDGYVVGFYVDGSVGGQPVKVRMYRLGERPYDFGGETE